MSPRPQEHRCVLHRPRSTGVADNSVCSPLVQSDVSQRATETSRRRSSVYHWIFTATVENLTPASPFALGIGGRGTHCVTASASDNPSPGGPVMLNDSHHGPCRSLPKSHPARPARLDSRCRPTASLQRAF